MMPPLMVNKERRELKRRESLAMRERINYVLSSAILLDLNMPYLNRELDSIAMDYMLNGGEELKAKLPEKKSRKNVEALLRSHEDSNAARDYIRIQRSALLAEKIASLTYEKAA